MSGDHFSEVATQAGVRYQSVLDTFRGLLTSAQMQRFSAVQLDNLRRQASSVAIFFVRSETDRIEEALRNTAIQSIRTARKDVGVKSGADLPQSYEAFLTQSESYLIGEVRAQLFRDVEAVCKRYREFAISTELTARAKGVSVNSAIAAIHSEDRFKFQFKDRVGRLYPAQKFIRSVWRHTLVCLNAEFYLLEASSAGVDQFTLEHPDDATWAGTSINMEPGSPLSFQAIRDEVFHPNSNYTVRATNVSTQ